MSSRIHRKSFSKSFTDPKDEFLIELFSIAIPDKDFPHDQKKYISDNFYLKTITIKKHKSATQEKSIAELLSFHVPLQDGYYEFFKLHSPNIDQNSKCLNQYVRHLLRFAVSFSFHFENSFLNLISGTNSMTITCDQLSKFSIINQCILKWADNDQLNDYFEYILPGILEQIEKAFQQTFQSGAMKPFAVSLAKDFLDYLNNNTKNLKINPKQSHFNNFYLDRMTLFLCSFGMASAPFLRTKDAEMIDVINGILMTFSKVQITSSTITTAVLSLIRGILDYFKNIYFKLNTNSNNSTIVIDDVGYLFQFASTTGLFALGVIKNLEKIEIIDLKNANIGLLTIKILSTSLCDYLEIIFYGLLKELKTIHVHQLQSIPATKANIDLNTTFITEELFRLPKSKTEFNIDFPQTLTKSSGYGVAVQNRTYFKQFTEKHKQELAYIICQEASNHINDEDRPIQSELFTIFILQTLPPDVVLDQLTRLKLWNKFLSENVFCELSEVKTDFRNIISQIILSTLCIEGNHSNLIETLGDLLFSRVQPHILHIIHKFCKSSNQSHFNKTIRNPKFMINIIKLDANIKLRLLNHSANDPVEKDELLEMRSKCLDIIKAINPSLYFNESFYSNQNDVRNQSNHIFSLFFEKALRDQAILMIINALPEEPDSVFDKLAAFIQANEKLLNNLDWQDALKAILEKIASIPMNNINQRETILFAFGQKAFGMFLEQIQQLCELLERSTNKDFITPSIAFGLDVLSEVKKLYQTSPVFLRYLNQNNDLLCFRTTFYDFLSQPSKVHFTLSKEHVDQLWSFSFLGDDSTIRNSDGLYLLVSSTRKTSFFKDIVDRLIKMCENSLFNRFQCSQADVIQFLLEVYEKGEGDLKPLTTLIHLIGQSYFKPNELKQIFAIIKNQSCSELIQLVSSIIRDSNAICFPEAYSFFHMGTFLSNNPSYFHIPFTVSVNKFQPLISFYVRFGQSIENSGGTFIDIEFNCPTSKSSLIKINLNKGILSINIDGNTFASKKMLPLPQLKWLKFDASVEKKEINIYVNNDLYIKTPKSKTPFSFNKKDSINLTIQGFDCDIESISIAHHREGDLSVNLFENQTLDNALFSARALKGDTCPNLLQSQANTYAKFKGFSVPFSMHIINTIANSGGLSILLPFFTIGDKKDCESLLQSLKSIIPNNEPMFHERCLFTAFPAVLQNKLTISSFQLLHDIYNRLSNSDLQVQMLVNILLNWNLVKLMTVDEKYKYMGVLCTTFDKTKNLFKQYTTVHTFFIEDLLENQAVWDIIYKRFSLEYQSENESLKENFMDILHAATCKLQTATFASNALQLIYKSFNENPGLIDILPNGNRFQCFFNVFEAFDDNEKIWQEVFRIYEVITICKPDNDYNDDNKHSINMLNCFAVINLSVITEMTLNTILSFIFQDPLKPSLIKNQSFIPFLCIIISQIPQKKAQETVDMIYNSLKTFEANRALIAKCPLWTFWILFLSQFSANDWIDLLAEFKPPQHFDPIKFYTEMESDMFTFCRLQDINYYSTMLKFAKTALAKVHTPEIFAEALKFLIFFPTDSSLSMPSDKINQVKNFKEFAPYLKTNLIDKLAKPPTFVWNSPPNNQEWFNLANECMNFASTNHDSLALTPDSNNNKTDPLLLLAYIIHKICSVDSYFKKAEEFAESFVQLKNIPKTILVYILHDFNGKSWVQNSIVANIDPKMTLPDPEKCSTIPPIQLTKKYQEIDIQKTINELLASYQEFFTSIHSSEISIVMHVVEHFSQNNIIYNCQDNALAKLLDDNREYLERLKKRAGHWIKSILQMASNGSVWTNESSLELHWKIDPKLDAFGRRLKMKKNNLFDDHHAASEARDQNIKSNAPTKPKMQFDEPTRDSQTVAMDNVCKFECTLVRIDAYFTGTVYFLPEMISFESHTKTEFAGKPENASKNVDIFYKDMMFICKRNFQHEKIGAEIFVANKHGYFFKFTNHSNRHYFLDKLRKFKIDVIQDIKPFTNEWMYGRISNYEYLFWVNMIAGRSFNDLAQYPVFPWIINDYHSDTIDLNDNSTYRDLGLPMGAIDQTVRQNAMKKYQQLCEDPDSYKWMYPFHYLPPGKVIYYLIRTEPFTTLHILFQSGKFDFPDRLFNSIEESYRSSYSTDNPDFRELIPEFFSSNEFLINSEKFDLGKDVNGIRVNDVHLPPWAKTAAHFIALNRIALESTYASQNIHKWIDLIFGVNQQEERAMNIFHPFSDFHFYQGRTDDSEKLAIREHALEFGVLPKDIFNDKHSSRLFIPRSYVFSSNSESYTPTINSIMNNLSLEDKPHLIFTCSDQKFENAQSTPNIGLIVFIESGKQITFQIPGLSYKPRRLSSASQAQSSKVKKMIDSDDKAFPNFQNRCLSIIRSEELFYNSRNPETLLHQSQYSKTELLVSSSLSMNSFDIYDIRGKKLVFSSHQSNMIPSLMTAFAADGDYCIAGTEDASLIVWSIKEQNIVTRIHAHDHRIVYVAYNSTIDLIVSIDITGKMSYSSAVTGTFLLSTSLVKFNPSQQQSRSISTAKRQIQSNLLEKAVQKVIISSLGFVIVISMKLKERKTCFDSFDLKQRKLGSWETNGSFGLSCLCVLQDQSQYLFFITEDPNESIMKMVSIIDLTQNYKLGKIPDNRHYLCCTFCRETNEIYLATKKEIFYFAIPFVKNQ